jgi:hypothetical protein
MEGNAGGVGEGWGVREPEEGFCNDCIKFA